MSEKQPGFGDLEPVINRIFADAGTIADAFTRINQIRATIIVNAIRSMGCSHEEAQAYADGKSEKPFVTAMCEYMEKQRRDVKLPSLRTEDGPVKTLAEWKEFARRDDCLDRMVPSDLRVILSNFEK